MSALYAALLDARSKVSNTNLKPRTHTIPRVSGAVLRPAAASREAGFGDMPWLVEGAAGGLLPSPIDRPRSLSRVLSVRCRNEALNRINRTLFDRAADRAADLPEPTIAAVNGPTVGRRAELAYSCQSPAGDAGGMLR